MSFSLATLSNFTLEDSGILVQKAVLGADLAKYVDVRPGYPEASVAINVLDTTPGFTGAACGWSDDGSVDFTQITVTNATKSWKTSLCLEDLRQYWLSTQLQASAFGEQLPFSDMIADQMVKETRKYAESFVSGQIITQVTSANGATPGGTAGAFTPTTAFARTNEMIAAIPADVQNREDLTMFMSYASFRSLVQNLVSLNLYHYSPGQTAGTGLDQMVLIPGTGIQAVPVGGFGSSQRVILGPAKHIIWVCGLVDDTERIEAWWSRDNQEIRALAKFTSGVGVLVDEFVTNDLA